MSAAASDVRRGHSLMMYYMYTVDSDSLESRWNDRTLGATLYTTLYIGKASFALALCSALYAPERD